MNSADSLAPGRLGIVTRTLSAEFAQATEVIERCSTGLPDDTASRQVGMRLRRVAGVLEMVGAPVQARFFLELAEIAFNGASSDAKAAAVAAGCLGAVASELGTGTAITLHPLLQEFQEEQPDSDSETLLRHGYEAYQRGLLGWLRDESTGLESMHQGLARVARVRPAPHRSLWRLAAIFIECLRLGIIPGDASTKKLCARMEQQLRRLRSGSLAGDAPLLCDILSRIAGPPTGSARLREAIAPFGLGSLLSITAEKLVAGAIPAPWRGELREALGAAKSAWEQFCEGRSEALAEFREQIARAAQNAYALGNVQGLLQAIGASTPRPPAMAGWTVEIAAALLAAENASELSRIDPSIVAGIEALTARLSAEPHAAGGMLVSPLFWLADSTAPAAHEVLARIKHAEHVLAEFLVDRSRAGELHALGLSLSACSAVLRMLGLDRAADLAIRIHGQVTELAQPDLPLTEERTWCVAEAICSLELYCQMLVERRGNTDFQRLDLLGLRDTELPITDGRVPKRKERPFANAPAEGDSQASPTGSVPVVDEADELLAVFIEESDEIVAALSQHVQRCRETLSDHAALTEIRRGFHTLKGSSRMVGLTALSASAWALEDLLNSWLELHRPATPALLDLLALGQRRFAEWTVEIKRDGCVNADNAELLASAARMKASHLCALAAATATPAMVSNLEAPDIVIGSAAIPASLFVIFQREAEEHHRRLVGQVDKLSKHSEAALDAEFVRPAHTLASISRAVGLPYLADLARALEQWLDTLIRQSKHLDEPARVLMHKALALVGDMLDALRQRQAPSGEMVSQGAAVSGAIVSLVEAMTAKSATGNAAGDSVVCNTATDPAPLMPGQAVASPVAAMHENEGADAELLSVFVEEGGECIAAIGAGLRKWRADPSEREAPQALLRALHNFKGGAHTTGVTDIGDLVHHFEGRVEALTGAPLASEFDDLEHRFDVVAVAIERLRADLDRRRDLSAHAVASPTAAPAGAANATSLLGTAPPSASGDSLLKVRVHMVERLLNQAGEISIGRSLVEAETAQLKRGLEDLLGVLTRLREQQHDIEIQTESQIHSRLPQRQASTEGFDPLELDRYTRVQEITRMMAESISDSRILQQQLDQTVERIGAALAEQGRITRQHHQDLMCVRALALRSVADRLYRVVRQAAREVGKDAGLVIHGEHLEFDRAVLDQLVAPLEHLLRNAVVHGIESPAVRVRAGKPEQGKVVLTVRQAPPGIVITVADDGAGLDAARLRAKAAEKGLIREGAPLSDEDAMHLIFSPGLSTAEAVTGLAGRGVGMDAVLNAVTAAGGRIEVRSEAGAGACFSLFLPVTHSIVHAVLVRAGSVLYAIPSTMFEQVLEAKAEHREGNEHRRPFVHASREYPAVHYLPRLLGDSACVVSVMRQQKLLLLHEGSGHAAVLVDEVMGNREVIVKGVGPQLSGVPGILGATALGDGRSVLILNPVQLAHRGEAAIAAPRTADSPGARASRALLVMVVDDSLTVRKFTERLLSRHGYEVTTARDGMDAMEQMAVSLPDVILLDIEMPRMDGFDLTRKLKQSPRTAHVPIIMITSRAATKHRRHALVLGVDAFLGKPYVEQQLLDQIAGLVQRPAA